MNKFSIINVHMQMNEIKNIGAKANSKLDKINYRNTCSTVIFARSTLLRRHAIIHYQKPNNNLKLQTIFIYQLSPVEHLNKVNIALPKLWKLT